MYIYRKKTPVIDNEYCDEIFLWKDNNLPIYVMDNHRLALWCWEKVYSTGNFSNIHLIHIDRHWDGATCSNIPNRIRPINTMSINHYRNQQNSIGNFRLFLWDNYIDYFLQLHTNVKLQNFSSNNKSIKKWAAINNYFNTLSIRPNEFLIINFDIDAIFSPRKKRLEKGLEKLCQILWQIKKCLRNYQSQIVITIALSQTCCYGDKSLNNLVTEIKLIERELDININLWKCLAPYCI